MLGLDSAPAVTVARMGSVPIRVDITFALVPIVLFLGLLGEASFSIAVSILIVLLVGIFVSILLHEIGHALAAKSFGLGVEEIRIGGFYGFAKLLGTAPSRSAAILILLCGPLANAALFLLFWGLLGFPEINHNLYFGPADPAAFLPTDPWVQRSIRNLAKINLALVVFNLLPAFPLDGGKIAHRLLDAVASYTTSVRIVAALGVLIGAWTVLAGFRVGIVLVLIGVEIVVLNWALLRDPHLVGPV